MGQTKVTAVHKFFNTFDDDVMRRGLLRLLHSSLWNVQTAADHIGMTRQGLHRIINSDAMLRKAYGKRKSS